LAIPQYAKDLRAVKPNRDKMNDSLKEKIGVVVIILYIILIVIAALDVITLNQAIEAHNRVFETCPCVLGTPYEANKSYWAVETCNNTIIGRYTNVGVIGSVKHG